MHVRVEKLIKGEERVEEDTNEEKKKEGNTPVALFLDPVFLKFMTGLKDPAAAAAMVTTLVTVSGWVSVGSEGSLWVPSPGAGDSLCSPRGYNK